MRLHGEESSSKEEFDLLSPPLFCGASAELTEEAEGEMLFALLTDDSDGDGTSSSGSSTPPRQQEQSEWQTEVRRCCGGWGGLGWNLPFPVTFFPETLPDSKRPTRSFLRRTRTRTWTVSAMKRCTMTMTVNLTVKMTVTMTMSVTVTVTMLLPPMQLVSGGKREWS